MTSIRQAFIGSATNDPLFSSVKSLLHFDGTNGSTTLTDQKGLALTANGGSALDTTASKFGGSSLGMTSHATYVSYNTTAWSDMGASDFCIEAWVNYTSLGANGGAIFGRHGAGGTGDILFYVAGTGQLIVLANSAGLNLNSGAYTVPAGTFTHVAVDRNGTTVRLLANGSVVGTATYSPAITYNSGRAVRIGIWDDASSFFNGRIDELRVTFASRYQASYTTPTSAFSNS